MLWFTLGSHEFDDVNLYVKSLQAKGQVLRAVFFVIEHLLFINQVVKKGSFGELLMVFEIFRNVISSIDFEILRPVIDTDSGPRAGSCGQRCRRCPSAPWRPLQSMTSMFDRGLQGG